MQIHHVQISIPEDMEKSAKNYYVNLLALEEILRPASLDGNSGFWLQCGSQQVHLGIDLAFNPSEKSHTASSVPDLEVNFLYFDPQYFHCIFN